MMPPSRVALEISGGLARIKFINSPRHNAMDLQFLQRACGCGDAMFHGSRAEGRAAGG
jgi:hypothetical protein